MNLGQFRELTKDMDDSVDIITVTSNFEIGHNLVKARASIDKYREEKQQFRDSFDGTRYSSTVYRLDDDGEDKIIISG